jgi:hypothetical protein
VTWNVWEMYRVVMPGPCMPVTATQTGTVHLHDDAPGRWCRIGDRPDLHRTTELLEDNSAHKAKSAGRSTPAGGCDALTPSTSFGVSAGHYPFFRVVSRRRIQRFRRSARFLRRVRFPAAPPEKGRRDAALFLSSSVLSSTFSSDTVAPNTVQLTLVAC